MEELDILKEYPIGTIGTVIIDGEIKVVEIVKDETPTGMCLSCALMGDRCSTIPCSDRTDGRIVYFKGKTKNREDAIDYIANMVGAAFEETISH